MVTLSGSAGRRLLHIILALQNVPQFQVVIALFVVAAAYLASAKPAIYSNTFAGQNSNTNITVRVKLYKFDLEHQVIFKLNLPITIDN